MTPPSSASPKPPQPLPSKPASAWQAYVLVALLTASATGAVAYMRHRPQSEPIVVHAPPAPVVAPTDEPAPTPAAIVVFVSGAVQQPAVYELPADARVADVLAAAGGFTEGADMNAVNQAERLWDGAQVHVPSVEEGLGEPVPGVSGDTRSGGVVVNLSGKIDVNTATIEQLMSLPNIGEVKAQAILDGRPYTSVEDLERVEGIGEKTIEKLREFVEVR